MEGYLGEILVNQKDTEFKDFNKKDWAIYFIEKYGGFDGSHHKDWVIDQVSRILKGTPIIKLARWKNGEKEYRIETGKPSQEYKDWVSDILNDGYSYEYGISP